MRSRAEALQALLPPAAKKLIAMRRSQRLIAAAVLAALSVTLAGCGGVAFDPTDLMDWFDTKKKVPGERKPVFPEGVPGVEQGVPRELYKGAHQQQEPPPPVAETPPAPEPKAKRSGTKSTARSAPRSVAPAEPAQDTPDTDEGAAAAPPAPPPARPKRQRITAPPPDPAPQPQQQAAPPAQSSPTRSPRLAERQLLALTAPLSSA